MKGTSNIHLDHHPAIKQAYAPQAHTRAILLYFMLLDVKKINLKKKKTLSHLLTDSRGDVCSTYKIQFQSTSGCQQFDYHEGQKMLLTDTGIFNLSFALIHTESLSVTAQSSTVTNKSPARPRHTHLHTHTHTQPHMNTCAVQY